MPDGTYSNTGGGLVRVTTANNWGFKNLGSCPLSYSGSVSLKMYNTSGESYLPRPSVTLTDGSVHYRTATLGNVLSGGAIVGFRGSTSIRWDDTAGTAGGALWAGAKVTVPYEFSYTAPDGSLHVGSYTLTYTMATFSAGVTPYTDLSTATSEEPPPTACS